jgi:hypothetical protein
MDEAVEAALMQASHQINALIASERRLIDELAALRKDAERYRKLQRWADAPNCGALQGFAHVITPGKFCIGPAMSAGALDAAIDAAPAVGAA